MSVARKLRRAKQRELQAQSLNIEELCNMVLTEQEYNLIVEQIKKDYLNRLTEYMGTATLAMALKIVTENYGALKKKESRAKVFCELYKESIESWGNSVTLEKYQKYLEEQGEPIHWNFQAIEEMEKTNDK